MYRDFWMAAVWPGKSKKLTFECGPSGMNDVFSIQHMSENLRESKIFGIGLSRTGTNSLNSALETLGFRSLHWPCDRVTQRELPEYFAGQSPFAFSIANEHDGITDTPAALVFRELCVRFPKSRFVLTLREKEQWLRSCEQFFEGPPVGDPPYVVYASLIRSRVYGRVTFERAAFEAAYERHVGEVRNWFRSRAPARLLEMDIPAGQGWPELCGFLGEAHPETPFPHRNRFGLAEGWDPI